MSALAREMDQRLAVLAEARRWVGTPWHHGARIRGAGVDCGQLLAAVYEAAGVVPHVAPEEYPQDWALHRGEERFLKYVESYAVKVPDPVPGDIALFQYGRCISHAGIVAEDETLIHAYISTGYVTVDNFLIHSELAPRLRGYWSPWAKEKR